MTVHRPHLDDTALAALSLRHLTSVVRVDSASDERSVTIPSTPGQKVLAEQLAMFFEGCGCQVHIDQFGTVIAELAGRGERADDPALAPFYQHCGLCHNSPDAFPPGFLHGDAPYVRERIDACAPRMLRRLSMWQVADAAREKTPMPPPAAAQADDIRARGDLPRMQAWLTTRLQAGGHDPAALAARAYADLPDCSIYRD